MFSTSFKNFGCLAVHGVATVVLCFLLICWCLLHRSCHGGSEMNCFFVRVVVMGVKVCAAAWVRTSADTSKGSMLFDGLVSLISFWTFSLYSVSVQV